MPRKKIEELPNGRDGFRDGITKTIYWKLLEMCPNAENQENKEIYSSIEGHPGHEKKRSMDESDVFSMVGETG